MITQLFFDFFGTLVSYSEGIGNNPMLRTREAFAAHGISWNSLEFSILFNDVWTDLEIEASSTMREYDMREGMSRILRQARVSASDDEVATLSEVYVADWSGSVGAIDGVAEMILRLGLPATVVSNTHHPPLVPRLIEQFQLRSLIGPILTSVEHGFRKPHPSIYTAALTAAECRPEEALFIGDNALCDYRGPRQQGMQAVLVSGEPVSGVPEEHRLVTILDVERWLTTHS